jgi:hypothetical protein
MNQKKYEELFSKERVQKYFDRFYDDEERAILLYNNNILLLQSLYPLLSITEISVRNAINKTMMNHYKSNFWFERLINEDSLYFEIKAAKAKIKQRNEDITSGKLTAELTFGFWTRLFNVKYEESLWKQLRLAFPNMPKQQRKRSNVSKPMNNIRVLRNRVYHYEPIVWNPKNISERIDACYNLLGWISPELIDFTIPLDNSKIILSELRKIL